MGNPLDLLTEELQIDIKGDIMSKVKDALLDEEEIEMDHYVKFMEFVCDQLLETRGKVDEEESSVEPPPNINQVKLHDI